MNAPACLVVMARAPELGRVKSRLARDLGAAAALAVYRQLLEITGRAAAHWPGAVVLASAGDEARFAGTAFAASLRVPQPDAPLGVRIAAAVRAGLARSPAAIVIGSDCPGLDAEALLAVTAHLTSAPVAFGPAEDGGFWAIATTRDAVADLVQDPVVPWSAPTTLAALRALLDANGHPSRLGPQLADCDTLTDLRQAIADGLLPPLPAEDSPRGR